MPTGYTAIIGEKKDVSFRDFTLRCARAFGACVMQRDDDVNALPEKQKPSTYHLEQLDKAKAELKHLQETPKEQLLLEAAERILKSNQEIVESNKRRLQETAELKQRYKKMLEAVATWTPPTDEHKGLKDFMTQQITESIDWDCKPYQATLSETDPEKFIAHEIELQQESIRYHQEGWDKDVARCKSQNAWIDALYNSL